MGGEVLNKTAAFCDPRGSESLGYPVYGRPEKLLSCLEDRYSFEPEADSIARLQARQIFGFALHFEQRKGEADRWIE
jgi:hypothetical protein